MRFLNRICSYIHQRTKTVISQQENCILLCNLLKSQIILLQPDLHTCNRQRIRPMDLQDYHSHIHRHKLWLSLRTAAAIIFTGYTIPPFTVPSQCTAEGHCRESRGHRDRRIGRHGGLPNHAAAGSPCCTDKDTRLRIKLRITGKFANH